jgi:hypothetical protein
VTTPAQQAQANIQQLLQGWLSHLGLVIRNNPAGTIQEILARPDINQGLGSALGAAQEQALAAVTTAWPTGGSASPTLQHLQEDVSRAYDDAAHQITQAVTAAWHAVPQQDFAPGVSTPGTTPALTVAAQRATAAQEAAARVARSIALRNSLSASVASSAGPAETLISAARADSAVTGRQYGKRWVSRRIPGVTCPWCWDLHGTVVPLDEEFPHPVPMPRQGHHEKPHPVKPPKLWHGVLFQCPLHPHCQCRIEIVLLSDAEPEPDVAPEAPQHPYLSSKDIAAMPEERYQGLIGFLRAALHELGQVIARLLSGNG